MTKIIIGLFLTIAIGFAMYANRPSNGNYNLTQSCGNCAPQTAWTFVSNMLGK